MRCAIEYAKHVRNLEVNYAFLDTIAAYGAVREDLDRLPSTLSPATDLCSPGGHENLFKLRTHERVQLRASSLVFSESWKGTYWRELCVHCNALYTYLSGVFDSHD